MMKLQWSDQPTGSAIGPKVTTVFSLDEKIYIRSEKVDGIMDELRKRTWIIILRRVY